MGGKGGDSGGSQMPMEQPTAQTTGGWVYSDTGTTTRPKTETPAKAETAAPAVTEDPSKQTGVEAVAQAETQPYAPPGFGNYPTKNADLSGLGDLLVSGMQAQPGKKGPQQYQGQV